MSLRVRHRFPAADHDPSLARRLARPCPAAPPCRERRSRRPCRRAARDRPLRIPAVGGNCESLLPQPLAGIVDRCRQRHRAAARHCSKADGNGRGIGQRDRRHPRDRPPGVGDDLSEDRLHSLALRARACRRHRSCRRARYDCARPRTGRRRCLQYSSRCPMPRWRPAARAFFWCSRNLSRPPTADERLVRRARIIAAVIDDGLAVTIEQCPVCRASRSGRIMLRRRTSAGSRPRCPAIEIHHPLGDQRRFGRPAPR